MENKARRVGRFINEDVSLSGSSSAVKSRGYRLATGWKRGLFSAHAARYNFDIIFHYETLYAHLYGPCSFSNFVDPFRTPTTDNYTCTSMFLDYLNHRMS